LHNPDEVLKLGLSHGLPEALHVALEEFRLLSKKERASAWTLINLISKYVELPVKHSDRNNHKIVGPAILTVLNTEFRHDEIRGQFIPVTQQN
jgi:hypothetical protein